MPQEITLDLNNVGCINLHGIDVGKFNAAVLAVTNGAKVVINVMKNPDQSDDASYLALDGQHHAFVQYLHGITQCHALLWDESEKPSDALIALNLTRAKKLHDTATVSGWGSFQNWEKQIKTLLDALEK